MNSCRHVQKVRPSSNNSVLNPQNWKCFTCQATENVWVGIKIFAVIASR